MDFGLIEGPCHAADIIAEPWLEDELVVFAAPNSPLLAGEVTLQQLAEAPWILREHGSGTREIVDYVLLSHLPAFHLGMELGNSEAIKHAVRHGTGHQLSIAAGDCRTACLGHAGGTESAIAPADAHAVADPSPAEAYF